MSLPWDIIQLFGTGSVPVVVAGSVLGVFELGERLASQRAKDALSQWLLSFDIQKAKALPDGMRELFARIFGERHFSLRCFFRSVAFSLGAMTFIGILCLLINPKEVLSADARLVRFGALWLPWCIIIDYVSLFKTRVILNILTRKLKTMVAAIAILAVDYFVYTIITMVGFLSVLMLVLHVTPGVDAFVDVLKYVPPSSLVPGPSYGWYFILFWAGFAPSIWMWLYVLALFVTRALLRSEKLVNWLRWGLDVEKNPFRATGAVAAALAFIASVAIILVSAEVSRITTAL